MCFAKANENERNQQGHSHVTRSQPNRRKEGEVNEEGMAQILFNAHRHIITKELATHKRDGAAKTNKEQFRAWFHDNIGRC